MHPSTQSKFSVVVGCDVHVARPQFADSVRATALGSIIASHLILICKRNPAVTALAGFEHPRSAPQHSVEILSVGVGCAVHVALVEFVDLACAAWTASTP